MQQTARKTVVAKILTDRLTNKKREAIEREYDAFQRYVHGEKDVELYSATKQQVGRKIDQDNLRGGHEYPWHIRNDTFDTDLRRDDNDVADWWLKVPVATVYGGVNVPIKPHEDIPEDAELCDSKIVRDEGEFYAHLSIEQQVEVSDSYSGVIGVDFGVRWAATSVALPSRNTSFYGEEIRRVRRHYGELRTRLQEKGAYRALQQVKDKERRVVEDRLHKISRSIVEEAKERNAFIVVGDLEGIDDGDKGAEMNRRLSGMPHYKLKQFIEYKSRWEGVAVVEVDEYMTSQTCCRCGNQETAREGQGRFLCDECGLDDNADKNGATSIAKRGLGKSIERPLSSLGASVDRLERCHDETTSGTVLSSGADTEAPTSRNERASASE
jgi:putative transposase